MSELTVFDRGFVDTSLNAILLKTIFWSITDYYSPIGWSGSLTSYPGRFYAAAFAVSNTWQRETLHDYSPFIFKFVIFNPDSQSYCFWINNISWAKASKHCVKQWSGVGSADHRK